MRPAAALSGRATCVPAISIATGAANGEYSCWRGGARARAAAAQRRSGARLGAGSSVLVLSPCVLQDVCALPSPPAAHRTARS